MGIFASSFFRESSDNPIVNDHSVQYAVGSVIFCMALGLGIAVYYAEKETGRKDETN